MKKLVLLMVVGAIVATLAASAAFAAAITHPQVCFLQAYPAKTIPAVKYTGFGGLVAADKAAIPGFFDIEPGLNWKNFVTAAKVGQIYTLKSVVLVKTTPQPIQCSEVFMAHKVTQTGQGIRLHWPLAYETPGAIWTLTILYGTKYPWIDGSVPGQTVGSVVHQDVWTWKLDVTWDSISDVLVLFHEFPFGLDEVPLISDEVLYPQLQSLISAAKAAQMAGNTAQAAMYLSDFELDVADACIASSPTNPDPTGLGTGIAQTDENPACCKLLVDVEFIFAKYGITSFN